jgi:hypothetical protein
MGRIFYLRGPVIGFRQPSNTRFSHRVHQIPESDRSCSFLGHHTIHRGRRAAVFLGIIQYIAEGEQQFSRASYNTSRKASCSFLGHHTIHRGKRAAVFLGIIQYIAEGELQFSRASYNTSRKARSPQRVKRQNYSTTVFLSNTNKGRPTLCKYRTASTNNKPCYNA